ncbi:MAG: exosome complex RNA-binding protein Csl4 [Candidatus Micrarchaeia archaeon]
MARVVVPGEHLGSEIEFLPGNGTYTEGEDIRSLFIGEAAVDATRRMRVSPRPSVPKILAPGMLVYGRVEEIFDPIALVRVEGIERGGVRPVSNVYYCVLHVSRIGRGFVKNVRDEIRIGDVIKAVVTEIKGEEVHLSMREAGLGVVKAFCSRCREALQLAGQQLLCPSCGNRERRRLGTPYRSL